MSQPRAARRFYHKKLDYLRVFMYAHPGVFSGHEMCPPTGGWYHAIESVYWFVVNRTQSILTTVLDDERDALLRSHVRQDHELREEQEEQLASPGSTIGVPPAKHSSSPRRRTPAGALTEGKLLDKIQEAWMHVASRDRTKNEAFESGLRQTEGMSPATSEEANKLSEVPRDVEEKALQKVPLGNYTSHGARLMRASVSGAEVPILPADEAEAQDRVLLLSDNMALVDNPARSGYGYGERPPVSEDEQVSTARRSASNAPKQRIRPPRAPIYAVRDIQRADAIWVLQCWNLAIDDICGSTTLNWLTPRRRKIFRAVLEDVYLNFNGSARTSSRKEVLDVFGGNKSNSLELQKNCEKQHGTCRRSSTTSSHLLGAGKQKIKAELPFLFGRKDDHYKGNGLGVLWPELAPEKRIRVCQDALQQSQVMRRMQKATLLEMAHVLNTHTKYANKPKIIASPRENGRADWLWGDPEVLEVTKDWILMGHMGLTAAEWGGVDPKEVQQAALRVAWNHTDSTSQQLRQKDSAATKYLREFFAPSRAGDDGTRKPARSEERRDLGSTKQGPEDEQVGNEIANTIESSSKQVHYQAGSTLLTRTASERIDNDGEDEREPRPPTFCFVPPVAAQHVRWGEFVYKVPEKEVLEFGSNHTGAVDKKATIPVKRIAIFQAAVNETRYSFSTPSTMSSGLKLNRPTDEGVASALSVCQSDCIGTAVENHKCLLVELRRDGCIPFKKIGHVEVPAAGEVDASRRGDRKFLDTTTGTTRPLELLDALVAKIRQNFYTRTAFGELSPHLAWVQRWPSGTLAIGIMQSTQKREEEEEEDKDRDKPQKGPHYTSIFGSWRQFAAYVQQEASDRNRRALVWMSGNAASSTEKSDSNYKVEVDHTTTAARTAEPNVSSPRGAAILFGEEIPATVTNVHLKQPPILLMTQELEQEELFWQGKRSRRGKSEERDLLVGGEKNYNPNDQQQQTYEEDDLDPPSTSSNKNLSISGDVGTKENEITTWTLHLGKMFSAIGDRSSGGARTVLYSMYMNQLYRLADWWRQLIGSEDDSFIRQEANAANHNQKEKQKLQHHLLFNSKDALRGPATAARMFAQDVIIPPMISLANVGSRDYVRNPWTRIFRNQYENEWGFLWEEGDTPAWWDYVSGRLDLRKNYGTNGQKNKKSDSKKFYTVYSAATEYHRRERAVFFAGGCNSVRRQELFLYLFLKKFRNNIEAGGGPVANPNITTGAPTKSTSSADDLFLHHLASSDHLLPEDLISEERYFNTTRRDRISNQFNNYMHTSKFCLVVPGSGLFTTRFAESIVSGCIPLIKISSVPLPFSKTLDWCNPLMARIFAGENFFEQSSKAAGDLDERKHTTTVPTEELIAYNWEVCTDVPAVFFSHYSQIEPLTADATVVTVEKYTRKLLNLRWLTHVDASIGNHHMHLLHAELVGSVAIWRAKRLIREERETENKEAAMRPAGKVLS
ncbi:unnamed protein product [Amoebophrya sp. A120]|nr:unnamed protein product [Amoebophrya sp. A120]|eukprot:GSA120T00003532001.1